MSTLVEETINKFVRDAINLIMAKAGFAIKANQNAPRPSDPYATVVVTSISSIGWEQSEYEDNDDSTLTQTISGSRDVLLTINTFRENAKTNAEAITIGFVRQSIIDLLNSGGFGLGVRTAPTTATEALEKGWEQRATFSVVLNTVNTDTDIVNCIESIDIDGEYQSRGITTNISIEV